MHIFPKSSRRATQRLALSALLFDICAKLYMNLLEVMGSHALRIAIRYPQLCFLVRSAQWYQANTPVSERNYLTEEQWAQTQPRQYGGEAGKKGKALQRNSKNHGGISTEGICCMIVKLMHSLS